MNIEITCLQKQNMKGESKKAEQIFSTVPFVIFRDKICSNRLEIYCTNQGHEESQKRQARLHEELAQRERVLRETQIRSIHEVEELKRAQEMRFDEFSRHELRESHATFQELTSQIQELQERMN